MNHPEFLGGLAFVTIVLGISLIVWSWKRLPLPEAPSNGEQRRRERTAHGPGVNPGAYPPAYGVTLNDGDLPLCCGIPDSMPAAPSGDPPPGMSSGDCRLWILATNEFRALRWSQKVALRYLYGQPGQATESYVAGLHNMDFAEPEQKILGPILGSSLVMKHENGNIFPSPQPVIRQTIEQALEKTKF